MSTAWELVYLGIGIGWGWALHVLHTLPNRALGLRVNEKTVYEMRPPVALAPFDHYRQWEMYTRRVICLYEVMERGNRVRGRRSGWLPSYSDLRQATGQTWRVFGVYDELLSQGGVIAVIGRGGRKWEVDYHARREAVSRLPYPDRGRPPRFAFQRDSVIAVRG